MKRLYIDFSYNSIQQHPLLQSYYTKKQSLLTDNCKILKAAKKPQILSGKEVSNLDKTSKDEPRGETGEEKKEQMPEDEGMGKDEPVYHDIDQDEGEEEKGSSS